MSSRIAGICISHFYLISCVTIGMSSSASVDSIVSSCTYQSSSFCFSSLFMLSFFRKTKRAYASFSLDFLFIFTFKFIISVLIISVKFIRVKCQLTWSVKSYLLTFNFSLPTVFTLNKFSPMIGFLVVVKKIAFWLYLAIAIGAKLFGYNYN